MERVILGGQARKQSAEDLDQFAEGVVKKVTPDGAVFTIPDWDDGKHLFGPAPWPMSRVEPADVGGTLHDHTATEPPAGSRCLVLFVGAGVDRPWILGWWS